MKTYGKIIRKKKIFGYFNLRPPPPPPRTSTFKKNEILVDYALKNIDVIQFVLSIFNVLQCDLIAVLFIISSMSNFNSFYQDFIELCGKSTKFCGHPHFPNPRPQTSAFEKTLPSLRTSFMDGRKDKCKNVKSV